ncbi:SET and MYND domain-containing protein 4-like [Copidosoma floridanum]|uniref:SET and MYND domain-containing protein 4-like n=1 Tax=Copidosoma floridanum TaxID=29053 RepID=UPI000C6F4EEB|nr:SET and MYND domain-containing protein 4-like [Copidosoma floridanum]
MDDIRTELLNKIKAAGRGNEMTFKFKLMETDELRVVMALSMMEMFGMVPKATCATKNHKTSIKLKNEANRIFVSSKDNVDDFIKAWETYSKSIAAAPNKSEELSLAYANRSAVLLRLHRYAECIEDINRALELNYPNKLRGKLLFRKIECLGASENSNDVCKVLDEATSWLENITLEDDEKQKYKVKLDCAKNSNFTESPKSKMTKNIPKIDHHPKIPCASEALALKYNDKFGRHIVTTRKIQAGEILVVEKPYAKILMPEEAYTHCSHCLQLHWALIPCETCTNAMYCSKKCKSEAWKQYHDIECPITGYLLTLGYNKRSLFSMRLAILALREVGSLKKLKFLAEFADSQKGFAEDGIYHSEKYCALHTLVTNVDKRSVFDLFERALNAAFILFYLYTKTTLFGKQFSPSLNDLAMNDDITYFGGIIMRQMQIIPSNIHSYEEERRVETVDIGAAALPFCSLINHSCDPNVSRCSSGDYMIVFAIIPIDKGAQIYDNYGIHYAVMDKYERREKLKQFYFECECTACKKDWPTYEKLTSFNIMSISNDKKKKIAKLLENFNDYVDYATEDEIEDKPYLLIELPKIISNLLKYVPLPCCEVNNAVETFKRVFALTYGNKFEFPKLR